MKVILQQDVLGVGEEGDVCEVAPGFARNYLFKIQAALPFTNHAMTLIEHRRDLIDKRKEEKRLSAATLKEQLEAVELTFEMNASTSGKLFGSINSMTIASELKQKGYEIERRRIEIPDQSLKVTGEHSVRVRLYEDQFAKVSVIVKSESE